MIFRQGRGGVKFEDVIGIFGCMRHCILVWIVLSRRWVRVALQFPGSTSSGDRIVVYEMANSQEVDLMSVGQHCSLESCHRLDLLPFTCSKCHQFYCSDHRKPGDHQCPVKDEVDVRVPVCPLCNQPIIKSKHQDVNVQMEYHIMSGCSDLLVKKKTIHRCSEKRCRQVQPIPFICPKCGRQFCVRHRHFSDHSCVKMVAATA
jgi:predicted nucleic acid binding AN1-type Zn finger protein